MRTGRMRLHRLQVWVPGCEVGRGARLKEALSLTLLLLIFTLGCVTPLPRPGQETPVAQTQTPSPTSPAPTVQTVVPTPTATLPTPTPVPTAAPTATLEPPPTRPTAVPPPPPSPTSPPEGPFLHVYAPEDGATVLGNTVAVYGQTSSEADVLVGGLPAEVDSEGGFRSSVHLNPGENVVEVVASTSEESSTTVSRSITSLFLPFLLLITEPKSESVVYNSLLPIAGRTGPNAIVSINGRSVPVDRFGYFTSSLLMDEGPNVIDVVATNEDGQTLSKVLAVIYRRLNQ